MNKYLPKFKAMVVTNNPMTNPADGWVMGFYFPKFIIYSEKVFSFVKTRSVPVAFQKPFLL